MQESQKTIPGVFHLESNSSVSPKFLKNLISIQQLIWRSNMFLRAFYKYTVGKANAYFDKNMLLLKNPQYLSDHYETVTQ